MTIVPDTWTGDGAPVFMSPPSICACPWTPCRGTDNRSLDYHQVSTTDMRHIYTWNDTLISDDQTKVQVWWNRSSRSMKTC